MADGDRLVLEVDVGTETPRFVHEVQMIAQHTSFGAKLTLVVRLLGTNGFPGDAVATKSRTRNRQATETIEDSERTILVHESLLDVVGRGWVRVFREVDGTVGVGGCCQDTTRHTGQTEITLEQAPCLQENEENASKTRRELVFIPVRGLDRNDWTKLGDNSPVATTYIRVQNSNEALPTSRLEETRNREQDSIQHSV